MDTSTQAAVAFIERKLDQYEPALLTLRELRDASERSRVTLSWRRELGHELSRRNLISSVPLTDAELDQMIEISSRKASWPSRLRRGFSGLSRGAKTIIAVISAVLTVVTVYGLVFGGEPRRLMSGDVNLMVAPFTDLPGAQRGEGVAESIARAVRSGLRGDVADSDVQVRGPRHSDAPESSAEARAVAEENGANIVVYGSVDRRHGTTVIRPRIYIDPRWLIGAEELGGSYRLDPVEAGSAGSVNTAAGRKLTRDQIVDQLAGLADFGVALSWLDARRWETALGWLRKARAATDGKFRLMVRLFEGNAAGALGRLSAARAAFGSALEGSDGEFGRARFGLIEVELHRAGRDCGRDANGARLRRVGTRFVALASEASGSSLEDRALRLRARLGRARTDFCLSAAGLAPTWSRAMDGFRTVLRQGSSEQGRFRTELAEAHGWLGFSLLAHPSSAAGARAATPVARRHLVLARQLADDPARRRSFAKWIDNIDASGLP